jgi:hypothetical protein
MRVAGAVGCDPLGVGATADRAAAVSWRAQWDCRPGHDRCAEFCEYGRLLGAA